MSTENNDGPMEYTEEMRELSGFGGGYEKACRKMALVGARFLIEKVDDATIQRWSEEGSKVFREDPLYQAFEKVVGEAEDGCTGAMHGAACSHAWNIRRMGWAKYKAKMIELRQAEIGS